MVDPALRDTVVLSRGSDAGANVQMYTSNTVLDPQSYMRAFVSRFASQKANR